MSAHTPELLAERDALETANNELRRDLDGMTKTQAVWLAENARLKAERLALRAALQDLERVSTGGLAGRYNGRMGDFHRECGNACENARAALAKGAQ